MPPIIFFFVAPSAPLFHHLIMTIYYLSLTFHLYTLHSVQLFQGPNYNLGRIHHHFLWLTKSYSVPHGTVVGCSVYVYKPP